MSDTDTGATVAAPPATEAPAPEPAAVEPQAEEQKKPRNKSEARRMAVQDAKRLAAQRAAEQPREPAGTPEGGQFVTDQAEAPVEQETQPEAVVEETPVDEGIALTDLTVAPEVPGEVAPDADTAVAEAPAAGTVTIPLPEGHPWRDRGETELRDIPAEQEEFVRAGINAAMQNRELKKAEERNALLEARLKALQGDLPAQFERDPKLSRLLTDISETYDAETAELVKAGFLALQNEEVSKVEAQTMAEFETRQYADSVRRTVFSEAPTHFPVWAQNPAELHAHLERLVPEYGDLVDARNRMYASQNRPPMRPTAQEFAAWVKANAYANDPRVKAQATAASRAAEQKREDEIRREVQAERDKAEAERLQDAAARHRSRPPSTPVTTTAGQTIPAEADDALRRHEAARSPNRKRMIRQQIREEYGRR